MTIPSKVNLSDTSIAAYHEGQEVFINREAQAAGVLEAMGPMTSNELYERHLKRTFPPNYRHNTHARLAGLRDEGIVRVIGKRRCAITGKTVSVWAIVPKEERRAVARAALEERLAAALNLVERLREKLAQLD